MTRQAVVPLTLVAVALAALLSAPRAASQGARSSRDTRTRDGAAVRAVLMAKLGNDTRFTRLTKVEFDPARGRVTLAGVVATRADRAAAGELASSVKGVQVVYNELQVERPRR